QTWALPLSRSPGHVLLKTSRTIHESVLPGVTRPSYGSASQPAAGPPEAITVLPARERARRRRHLRQGVPAGLEALPPALLPLAQTPDHRRRTGRGLPSQRPTGRPP